jgi:hypothetical protein
MMYGAGWNGWFGLHWLLMIVPMVNLIALYVLAFSDWSGSRRAAAEAQPGPR